MACNTSRREIVEDVGKLQGTVTDTEDGRVVIVVMHNMGGLGGLRLLRRVSFHNLRPCLPHQRCQRSTTKKKKQKKKKKDSRSSAKHALTSAIHQDYSAKFDTNPKYEEIGSVSLPDGLELLPLTLLIRKGRESSSVSPSDGRGRRRLLLLKGVKLVDRLRLDRRPAVVVTDSLGGILVVGLDLRQTVAAHARAACEAELAVFSHRSSPLSDKQKELS